MVTSSEISSTSSEPKAPFESLTFLFNDRPHGRILLRINQLAGNEVSAPGPFDDEFDFSAVGAESDEDVQDTQPASLQFNFHYEVGAAGRDQSDDIALAFEQVQQLQDDLVKAGVYLWDPSYNDAEGAAPSRWNLTIVLQKDVFTQTSRGGSDYPEGFADMIEAFHRIGLPDSSRTRTQQSQSTPFNPMGAGFDPSSFNPNNFNPNDMFAAMQSMLQSGAPQQAMQQMQEAMNQLRDNPQAFQERLRSEFRSLSPEQQNELLNMLGSTGMVSREWWENFFRG